VTQAATNILMVEGTVDSAEEVDPILLLLQNFVPQGRVINALRVGGVMQVQLDVTVASINRDKARELGFNFQNGQRPWYMGGQIGSIMAPPQVSTPTGAFLPGAGGSSTTPLTDRSTMFFGIAMPDDSFYGYLRALQENRCFKVLANPSLVTLSGRPARFQVGGEQPYPVPYGVGQTPQISFKPFGTTLVFTPLVLGQGKIRLDLQPTVSRLDPTNSVSLAGTTVPGIVTQEIKATVEMESGQTLVLGGLLESQITAQIEKVPVLGDVPFAGALFRRVQHVEQEKELMILATPHLVSPLEPQQFPERLPGDETRSPKDCELYLHGRPEVATGPCDVPTGLRSQLGAPPQGEPEPYPTWPPRNPGGPAPVGPRPEPDATPGPNLVPPPVDLSATSRLQRPTHATAGYSAPAESVGRGPQDSVAPLRRLPDAHLPPRLIGGPVRDGSPAQVVFPTYRQESP
jgi:pilus assembly protein CpaC